MVNLMLLDDRYNAKGLPFYWLGSTYHAPTDRSCTLLLCPPGIFHKGPSFEGPKPENGKLSPYSNRSCFHPNLHGTVYGVQPNDIRAERLLLPFQTRNDMFEVFIDPIPSQGFMVQANFLLSHETVVWCFSDPMPYYSDSYGWGSWYCDQYYPIFRTGPVTSEDLRKAPYVQKGVRKYDPDFYVYRRLDPNASIYRGTVKTACQELSRHLPMFDEREVFGTLNDECASQARYVDCNTPMLMRELLRLKKDTTALVQLLGGKISHKTLSSLFLSQKYGARLTVRDAKLILDKVTDHLCGLMPPQDIYRVHSRKHLVLPKPGEVFLTDFECDVVSTIWYKPRPQWTLDRSIHQLAQWDMLPTLQNVWDFIPYSFVVDWFLDVEGALVSLDNKFQWQLCQVLENVESKHYETYVSGTTVFGTGVSGDLRFTVYNRKVQSQLTSRQFHFTPSLKNPIHHVAELGALIAQKV